MKNKIISRAFNGWLEYHRYTKKIKKSLVKLVELNRANQVSSIDASACGSSSIDSQMMAYLRANKKLDEHLWGLLLSNNAFDKCYFNKIIYENGIESASLRKKVWPYLLEFYTFEMTSQEVEAKYKKSKDAYVKLVAEWRGVEECVLIKHEAEKTPTDNSASQKKNDDDSGIYSDTFLSPSGRSTSDSSSSSILSDSLSHFSPKSIEDPNSRVHSQTPISVTNTTKENKFSLLLGELAEQTWVLILTL